MKDKKEKQKYELVAGGWVKLCWDDDVIAAYPDQNNPTITYIEVREGLNSYRHYRLKGELWK